MMKKGFTLIETLVAVGILSVAIAGAFSAAQGGISSSTLSKNQITAFYLAQEAVEQIRNIRDENGLNERSWVYGITAGADDPCFIGNACTVNVLSASTPLTRCSSGPDSCPNLRHDISTGLYGYDAGWQESPFQRVVTLEFISNDEISILVTVKWEQGLITREFRVRENIFNWQ